MATIDVTTPEAVLRTGGMRTFGRLLRESPRLLVGLIIFAILVLTGVLEQPINRARIGDHLSTEVGIFDVNMPPSAAHPLGTDFSARDELALLVTGIRNSLVIGFIAGGIGTGIAILLATLAGYFGGRTESFVTAVTNSVMIIPSLPVLAIISTFVFRPNIGFLSLALAFFSWPFPTRVIMPQIRSLRERPFVDMARVNGYGSWSVMFLEIVPNFLPFIVLGLVSAISGSILAETGLRLLGLGPATAASLGTLIQATLYTGTLAQGLYLIALSPIVVLILIFVSLNLINFGLEEVYNPRLKKITGL
jgi:peptide/nickel transport system permease protein